MSISCSSLVPTNKEEGSVGRRWAGALGWTECAKLVD